MLRFHPSRFIWVLALMLGIWMVGSQAQEYRYHYVSLSKLVPEGYGCFWGGKITNSGRVYGTTYKPAPDWCDELTADNIPYVAVYNNGTITVLQAGEVYTGNEGGTIGGSVFDENNVERAALFHGNKVERIQPEPPKDEIRSFVMDLTDSGIALVASIKSYDQPWRYALYKNGRLTPLNFWFYLEPPWLWINNQGLIAGNMVYPSTSAFVFDPRSGELTLLNPLSPHTISFIEGINNRGDVVGHSFEPFSDVLPHIGVWSNRGQFETYFEGSTEEFRFPIVGVRFNDNNLIVISSAWYDFDILYLVPRPGVWLDLANLVVDLPLELKINGIFGVNNHGDMVGNGFINLFNCTGRDCYDTFLLERVGPGKPLK